MFYSEQLLTKNRSISMAWLMSTLGQKRVHKKDVMCASIAEICKTVQDPVAPMALRFSSQLLHGTVLLYNQQTVYLLADAASAVQRLISTPQDNTVSKCSKFQVNEEILLHNDPVFALDLDIVPELPQEYGLSGDDVEVGSTIEERPHSTLADLELEMASSPNNSYRRRSTSSEYQQRGGSERPMLVDNYYGLPGDTEGEYLNLDIEPVDDEYYQNYDIYPDLEEEFGAIEHQHHQQVYPRLVEKNRKRRCTILDNETTLSQQEIMDFARNYEVLMVQNKRQKMLDRRGKVTYKKSPNSMTTGTYEMLGVIVGYPFSDAKLSFLDISLDAPGEIEHDGITPISRKSSSSVELGREREGSRLSRTPSVADFPRSSQTPPAQSETINKRITTSSTPLNPLEENLEEDFQLIRDDMPLDYISDENSNVGEDTDSSRTLLLNNLHEITPIYGDTLSFHHHLCPVKSTNRSTAVRGFYNLLSLASSNLVHLASVNDNSGSDIYIKLV